MALRLADRGPWIKTGSGRPEAFGWSESSVGSSQEKCQATRMSRAPGGGPLHSQRLVPRPHRTRPRWDRFGRQAVVGPWVTNPHSNGWLARLRVPCEGPLLARLTGAHVEYYQVPGLPAAQIHVLRRLLQALAGDGLEAGQLPDNLALNDMLARKGRQSLPGKWAIR